MSVFENALGNTFYISLQKDQESRPHTNIGVLLMLLIF